MRPRRSRHAPFLALLAAPLALACGGSDEDASEDPGALVRITAKSRVGVLLDELPTDIRDRVAADLLARPEAFFIDRAKRQLALATYRLNFRAAFYDEDSGKHQLPLPPDSVLRVSLVPGENGAHARREQVEGHDYVLADYEIESVAVTAAASPGETEPALAAVDGTWAEPFTFPVDPELLVQRTGYACMDEAEFPRNSVTTENPDFFYDQECEVETELSLDGCHGTALPTESCQDALAAHVGRVDTALEYERIAWDEALADQYRVGEVRSPGASDLEVVTAELEVNQLVYRYVESDSCAIAEGCVGGTGWRRLLLFNASEKNVGTEPVHVGEVDYYLDDPANPTANANHHVYSFSECHQHYHFDHFATFTYGDDPDLGSKRAFCLESVARYANHEKSPLWSPYNVCSYQGISAGWGDQYNAGIECQWIDVTSVDTTTAPVTRALGLRSNPEGILCEGEPVRGADGEPVWEPTELRTPLGEVVDRPACTEAPRWEENNYGEHPVTLPLQGEGMLTSPCERGQIGPRRNCGFKAETDLRSCTPGATVTLSCTIGALGAPAVVRVCEASVQLGSGLACMDADALGAATVGGGETVEVSFPCPSRRDAMEPGGSYSLYTAAAWPGDDLPAVDCVAR